MEEEDLFIIKMIVWYIWLCSTFVGIFFEQDVYIIWDIFWNKDGVDGFWLLKFDKLIIVLVYVYQNVLISL